MPLILSYNPILNCSEGKDQPEYFQGKPGPIRAPSEVSMLDEDDEVHMITESPGRLHEETPDERPPEYELEPEGKPRPEPKPREPKHPGPESRKPIEISEEPVMPKYIDIEVKPGPWPETEIPPGYEYTGGKDA